MNINQFSWKIEEKILGRCKYMYLKCTWNLFINPTWYMYQKFRIGWLIFNFDWLKSIMQRYLISCWRHIFILSQPCQGILTFFDYKIIVFDLLVKCFFLNCAFKDLHSKRGEMEKKQAAVSIRIVNLWECGATKLMKGDCSSCHYSVLFDDRYSTIYASLTVVSWYQKFEKKLLNNWEKKLFCFSSDSIILLSIFLIPQPILVTALSANCMLGLFSLPQVSDVAHGALVFKLILIRL